MCQTNLHKNIWKFAKQNTLCSKILNHQKWFEIPQPRIIILHHKLHGTWFDNNSHVKSTFQSFVWNRHECHSFICIVWISMSCKMFKHKCCMSIHVIYAWKSCTWLLCFKNAWHSYLNNMNIWNNRYHTNLKWTHEAYKFVM
jgi:hypothetical protein